MPKHGEPIGVSPHEHARQLEARVAELEVEVEKLREENARLDAALDRAIDTVGSGLDRAEKAEVDRDRLASFTDSDVERVAEALEAAYFERSDEGWWIDFNALARAALTAYLQPEETP